MSHKINNDNVDNEGSVSKTQDATFTSTNTLIEKKPEPTLKCNTIDKKSFSERWKTNRFLLVRGSFYALRSVWMVAMVIGGFIAWLISLLFI